MAGKKDELWDANRDRDSIHIYTECEEADGYDDELDFDEEIPLELSSLAPTDEWYLPCFINNFTAFNNNCFLYNLEQF